MLAAVAGCLVGALTAGDLNEYLGVGAAITALSFGAARSAAVLLGRSKKEIERAGAIGFVFGLALSAIAALLLLFL